MRHSLPAVLTVAVHAATPFLPRHLRVVSQLFTAGTGNARMAKCPQRHILPGARLHQASAHDRVKPDSQATFSAAAIAGSR
ncbi:hypothetical protein [Erwinia pyrifoliae]|uniref:hypothetical protein n=1 Tax=Erwinia pyrifoliae TaxID=79967 RepID=UPI0012FF11BC